jgi:glycosyltransferase involved in cell wall biosynthesis
MQTISVIVEWENAKLSDLDRARRMLNQLGRQMAALARKREIKAELILLYDGEAVDRAIPKAAVAANIPAVTWPGTIQIANAPGKRYYEQKNVGAKLSTGETIVLLDSDVVPDDGWLEGLIRAMDDPSIQIVGGETYHATETFHDRLFAAFWTFGVRQPSRHVYRYKNFYANNVAMRRALFLSNPFPDAPSNRGQCSALARRLREKNIPIYRQGDSTVSHPPPEGMKTFVARALCQGYDAMYWKRQAGFVRAFFSANPLAALWRFLRNCANVVKKVVTRFRKVGLGMGGAAAALGVGFGFYFFKFVGEVVSFFAPGLIRDNLAI